jgi:MFS family permease
MTDDKSSHDRRNYLLNMTEGALWNSGGSFIASATVLPALVLHLGGGNVAVGSINVLVWVGILLPQTFAARFTQNLEWKKPWAVRYGAMQRAIVFLIGIIVLAWGASYPGLTLALFFLFLTMNQVFIGVSSPGWFDMYAKLTPLELRGRLTGIRSALSGAGSFACSFLLTFLLANFVFPYNYGLAFLIASAFQFSSLILLNRLAEDAPSKILPLVPLKSYLLQLKGIFAENIDFRRYVIACILLTFATIPVGFMMVYALHRFDAGEAFVGRFTIIIVSGQIAGSVLNGFIADRRGNKLALLVASASLLAASICAFLAPSLAWFYPAFFFLGINIGSELMTRYNLAIEFCPVEQRSTYLGLMNTMMAPFFLVGIFGGWLADVAGYQAVFGAGILCSLIAITFLAVKVKEPRHG